MSEKKQSRVFSTAFKVALLVRLEGGERSERHT
jgi:hypothetical protein